MCISPIITATNYNLSCGPVFRAGAQRTALHKKKNVMPAESGASLRDNGKNISENHTKNTLELSSGDNYYYNRDIVEEIGADGRTYLSLEKCDSQKPERIDSVSKKDPLGIYFEQVHKYTVQTVEEEEQSTENYCQTHDAKTMETLIKSNLRFVIDVAKEYRGMGLPFKDLLQEGNLGLIRAAETFDETRGFRFCSYAVKCIKSAIKGALRMNSRTIRIPGSVTNRVNDIKKATAQLMGELGRHPTLQEIADKLNLPERKILAALNATKMIVRVDAPVFSEDDSPKIIDNIASEPEDFLKETEDVFEKRFAIFKKVFNRLSAMEQEVISLRYGLNNTELKTVGEIASMYNISPEEVSRIEARSVRFLKKYCRRAM